VATEKLKEKTNVYKKIIKEYPIFEKQIFEEGKINFITLEHPKKTNKTWKKYQTKPNTKNKLKRHNGNIGIVLGFDKENRDYWLGGLDIDGFNPTDTELKKFNNDENEIFANLTAEEKRDYKIKTRKDLYDLLKDLSNVWIDKTANQGYHIFYWTTKDFVDKYLKNIYYPEDYPIEILRNKSITYLNKHIEHFTHGRQFVAPFSEIEQKDGIKPIYKIISTKQEINEFFENPKPKENILNEIKKIVKENKLGFIYKEPEKIQIEYIKPENKENNHIAVSNGSVKSKIYDPEIREELLKKIIEAGYVETNRNNFGYILICNFRRHGLNENEVFNIFKELKIPQGETEQGFKTIKGWISNKFRIDLDNIDNKKFASFNALKKEILALNNPESTLPVLNWFQIFFNKKQELKKPQIAIISYTLRDYFNNSIPNKKIRDKEHMLLSLYFIKLFEKYNVSDGSIYEVLKLSIEDNNKLNEIIEAYYDENFLKGIEFSKLFKFLNSKKIISPNQLSDIKRTILAIVNPPIVFNWLTKSNKIEYQLKASKVVEKEYDVKRTVDKFYYYDEKQDRHIELNQRTLGTQIRNDYEISLQDTQLNSILTGIQREDIPNPYAWGFENGLLDIRDGTFIENKKSVFTIRYLGFTDELTGEFKPFTYNPDINTAPNWNYNEITRTQRTLQEILIPKNDKDNETLYYDHLQRLGSNLHPINKSKKISVYFDDIGNNGKEILKIISELTLNGFHANLKPNEFLNDTFGESTTQANKNRIFMDETKRNTFIGNEDTLKRRSSGGRGVDSRKIQSADVYKAETNPMMYILSNFLFIIDIDDTALLYRTDFLRLPNTFVEKSKNNLENNEYIKDPNLDNKLKKDFKGLEWYVNAQIKEYLGMKKNKESFLASQSAFETLMIINTDNPIQNWFKLHIEVTNKTEDIISNNIIKPELESFIKREKIDYDLDKSNLSIDVGNWLKEYFENQMNNEWKIIKIRKSSGISYRGFKFKSDRQIEKDYSTNYIIDESTGIAIEDNLYMLNEDEKRVFNKIKDNPRIHHKELRKEYPGIAIETVIDNLYEKNFVKEAN